MKESEGTRTRAERHFQDWLDLHREGDAPELEAWLETRPPEVRTELSHMIGDYLRLGKRLGEGAPTFEAGRQVGDFRLVRELGRGGMGVVWEAEQLSIKRRVALKLLFPHFGLSQGTLQRFHREAEAGGRLAHQGIVQVYAVGEADGLHYMAQELVPSGYTLADSIADLREESDLPEGYYRGVAQLFARIGEALAHAHAMGVVHRDVKPSNILIAENDQPKLVDFGMARVEDTLSLSRTGEFLGTPFYMSPEQAASKRMGIDHRTDVFSLGATLYEALTLTRAFDGDTSQQVIHKILTWDPPDPQAIRSRVPRDLGVICQKALEKDPDRRYATMDDFAADLRRFLANEPIYARPPSPLTRAMKWTRRHPLITSTGALAFVALALITGLLLEVQAERDEAQRQTGIAREAVADLERQREVALAARDDADRQRAVAEQALDEAERQRKRVESVAKTLDLERRSALKVAEEREWQAYVANLHSAQIALSEDNNLLARRRLDACAAEMRGWEWGHMHLQADPSLVTIQAHDVPATGVAFLPGGDLFVTTSSDRTLRVWQTDDGRLYRAIPASANLTCLAVSPDGRRIAAGTWKGPILFDALTWSQNRRFEGQTGAVRGVAFSPAGDRIASAATDGTVFVWDASGEVEPLRLGERLDLEDPESVVAFERRAEGSANDVAFDRRGERVAAVSGRGWLRVWEARDGTLEAQRLLGEHTLRTVAFAPDGSRLAVGSSDGAVHVLDAEDLANELVRIDTDGEAVDCLAWSSDGRRIATGGGDRRELCVWDAATGEELLTLGGFGEELSDLAFRPGGGSLVVASADGMVQVLDERTSDAVVPLAGHGDRVRAVAFHPDGSRIASVSDDRQVRLWEAGTGEPIASWNGRDSDLHAVAFSPDGTRLASAGKDHVIRLWDAASRTEVAALEGHEKDVYALAFSPDGARLASASADRTARVWDLETGATALELVGHGHRVYSVAFSPDGARIATGSTDRTVRVWNARTGELIEELTHHPHTVHTVAFSPDGDRLLSLSLRDSIVELSRPESILILWDAWTLEPERTLRWPRAEVRSAVFGPDGKRIALGLSGGGLMLVDPENGTTLARFGGAEGDAACLAFSPDGTQIVTGNQAGVLHLWETELDAARAAWATLDARRWIEPLVDSQFDELVLREAVLARLPTLPVLRGDDLGFALRLAGSRPDPVPEELEQLCWDVVERPDSDPEEYLRAVRQAEAACRLVPASVSSLSALAAAQYRAGRWQESVGSYERLEELWEREDEEPDPRRAGQLAILAMAQWRLGHHGDARVSLDRAREALLPGLDPDGDLLAWVREAEELIGDEAQ